MTHPIVTLFARVQRLIASIALAVPLLCAAAPLQEAEAQAPARAHVYFFNGILGIFFSTGLHEIADRLNARGIDATTYGPSEWRYVTKQAVADYTNGRAATIILVGYSAGVKSMNEALARLNREGIPVKLAIALDPQKTLTVSGTVNRYVTFYSSNDGGKPVGKGAGFGGTIETISLNGISGIDHKNVDDNAAVQAKILGAIRSAL